MDPKPRPTGKAPSSVNLTGKLVPWSGSAPVFLNMRGMPPDHLYIALFSDEAQLRTMLAAANVPFERIQKVLDGAEFWASIPTTWDGARIHIIVDPYITANGRVRYQEAMRS